jgi:transcription elongation GreA/GreB family factor
MLEDLTMDQLRITQLERLVACATVVDHATAAPGSERGVRVQDQAGETVEYELVGTRRMDAGREHRHACVPGR